MNSVHEETNQTGYIPALARREKIPWKWIYLAWPASLLLVFCAMAIFFHSFYGGEETVFINGQGISTEQMVRKDFEKWSADKLASFENRLQSLQERAKSVRGDARPEVQRTIDYLRKKQDDAQTRLSILQNTNESVWSEARRDMIAIIRNLEKAHYRAATHLTGFVF